MTSDTHPQPHDDPAAGSRAWLVPAGLALALAALLAGLLLGRGMTGNAAAAAATDPVSVGFLRDMKVHHAQAVEMSEIVHRRSDDPAINYLAFDILSTQQGQIGIMAGWLDLSRQTQSGGERMAWMGHEGPMPGMAGDEQVAELNTLPVPRMEEQYLRLMIHHHRGALPMTQQAAERSGSTDVADLAGQMHAGQASEIDLMQRLLAERGLAPEPEDPADGHGTTHRVAGRSPQRTPSPSHAGH